MITPKLKVVAAIPNYNMASSLELLLPSLLGQGYDHIYVLDDTSTDESEAVVATFGSAVTFVKSIKNGGAGAARNMMVGRVDDTTLIHFLDADITVTTPNSAAVARRLFTDSEKIGFIGGLVQDRTGRQSYWNYGERQSLSALISSWGQAGLEHFGSRYPKFERAVYAYHLWPWINSRPNTLLPASRHATMWVLEANLLIMAGTLKALGGFDASIREHDIQPLAAATQKAGRINYFDPSIAVTHNDVRVRKYNRTLKAFTTEMYLAKKLGIVEWLFSGTRHNS